MLPASKIFPNTQCFPFKKSAFPVVMKNWQPVTDSSRLGMEIAKEDGPLLQFVFGPEFALDNIPGKL